MNQEVQTHIRFAPAFAMQRRIVALTIRYIPTTLWPFQILLPLCGRCCIFKTHATQYWIQFTRTHGKTLQGLFTSKRDAGLIQRHLLYVLFFSNAFVVSNLVGAERALSGVHDHRAWGGGTSNLIQRRWSQTTSVPQFAINRGNHQRVVSGVTARRARPTCRINHTSNFAKRRIVSLG